MASGRPFTRPPIVYLLMGFSLFPTISEATKPLESFKKH